MVLQYKTQTIWILLNRVKLQVKLHFLHKGRIPPNTFMCLIGNLLNVLEKIFLLRETKFRGIDSEKFHKCCPIFYFVYFCRIKYNSFLFFYKLTSYSFGTNVINVSRNFLYSVAIWSHRTMTGLSFIEKLGTLGTAFFDI